MVRPSYTYGPTWIPSGFGGQDYTVVGRMRRGRPIVCHGDGTSLWVMTAASDFAVGLVGLLGQEGALGEAFHITSDEVLTWQADLSDDRGGGGRGAPDRARALRAHRRRSIRSEGAAFSGTRPGASSSTTRRSAASSPPTGRA